MSELEESCRNLAQVAGIEQLYLTGNPCTDWDLYKKVVIGLVPQLKQLDAKDVTHSERLDALQELPSLLNHLKVAVAQGLYQKPTNYTIESRLEMAKENKRIQDEKENEKKAQEEKEYGEGYLGIVKRPPPPVYNDKGEVRQTNQGGYEYSFFEKHEKNKQFIILEVNVPKYLDTSQMDVDLNPTYVRISIKGKILQLTFPCEIIVVDSLAKRSQTTGSLQLTMPKLKNSQVPYFYFKEEKETQAKQTKGQEKSEKGVKNTEEVKKSIEEVKSKDDEPWEDDDEVPPLE